jgi:hypothetical protein
MRMAALIVKPGEQIVRTEVEAYEEWGIVEPEYESLRGIIGAPIEHVRVAPHVSVWCDEMFRVKGLKPSAIIVGDGGAIWDFGGPIVVTGRTREELLAWASDRLRIPGDGYRLEPGRITILTQDEDGVLREVHSSVVEPGEGKENA